MQNSTTSNITMSHTKQHREETFPFDGGLGIASGVGGIIPAHAGLTAYSISFAHCARDHSRVCGAHSGSGLYLTHFGGSSPRMRGSPEHGRLQSGHAGIIPAYAGLTHLQLVFCRCIWNHPRVCEAHESTSAGVTRSLGSSPRMRGSRSQTAAQRQRPGIIPAHAGLTYHKKACSHT